MTVLQALAESHSRAGEHTSDDPVAPVMLLWSEEVRQRVDAVRAAGKFNEAVARG